MNIPKSIINAVQKQPYENNSIYGAQEVYPRLKSIRNNEIPYINADMSTLANFLELTYKGFLEGAGMNDKIPNRLHTTHNLNDLVDFVETLIMPMQSDRDRESLRERRKFLSELKSLYIDARYNHAQVPKEDYDIAFDWCEKQYEMVMCRLKPPVYEASYDEEDYENEY